MRLGRYAVVVLLVGSIMVSGCGADAGAQLAGAIAADLRRDREWPDRERAWPVASVVCPSAGTGERFECTVTFEDGTVAPVSVEERDRALRWSIQIVHADIVRDAVVSAADRETARVDCGSRTVLVVSPSERLRCRVERQGSVVAIDVTWRGTEWVAERAR